mgnify:CR=1 FL=1
MGDFYPNQGRFSGMSDGQIIATLSQENENYYNQINNLFLMTQGKMSTDIIEDRPNGHLYSMVSKFIIEKRKESEEMK